MGSPQRVDRQPAFGLEADVGQRAEDLRVEDFRAIGPLTRSMSAFCVGSPG